MKKRLIVGWLAVVLVVGGVGAGATAGKLMPGAGQFFGATPAGAASLNVAATAPLTPAGSGFTYQGRLNDRATPAEGRYDFQFSLYDEPTRGTLIAGPLTQLNQAVRVGLFTVLLDFGGSPFNGDARYLEISVRPADTGEYTTLAPRQPITPAPYALYALKTKGYKNVVTVSPEGGDFTTVQAALNSITTNSSTNKYLVWVGPGTYTERVTMKEWVDIEGAGEKTTKITYVGSASNATGTAVGASNAELRSLTVENTGGEGYAMAIYNDTASPSLLHVTAAAFGGTFYNIGVCNFSASPSMTSMTASASGGNQSYGVFNQDSSPGMTSMTASASGSANSFGVFNNNSSPNMTDMIVSASGTYNIGVYNVSSSPTMADMTVSASGGTYNHGVYNNNSSPSMTSMTASASGSANSYGVANYESSSPNMANVIITASAGTTYGVYNNFSSPRISNSKITGGMDAIFSTGSGTVLVQNSQLTGNVWNDSSTVKVGGSYLNGFIGGPGGVTCAGNYNASFVFFPSTCP